MYLIKKQNRLLPTSMFAKGDACASPIFIFCKIVYEIAYMFFLANRKKISYHKDIGLAVKKGK